MIKTLQISIIKKCKSNQISSIISILLEVDASHVYRTTHQSTNPQTNSSVSEVLIYRLIFTSYKAQEVLYLSVNSIRWLEVSKNATLVKLVLFLMILILDVSYQQIIVLQLILIILEYVSNVTRASICIITSVFWAQFLIVFCMTKLGLLL